jgi:hypothetical protein
MVATGWYMEFDFQLLVFCNRLVPGNCGWLVFVYWSTVRRHLTIQFVSLVRERYTGSHTEYGYRLGRRHPGIQ